MSYLIGLTSGLVIGYCIAKQIQKMRALKIKDLKMTCENCPFKNQAVWWLGDCQLKGYSPKWKKRLCLWYGTDNVFKNNRGEHVDE